MFKKLKDKITEEVSKSPRNLFQPSTPLTPQAETPLTTPNESFSSNLNESSSDVGKGSEFPTSPEPGGFTSIDLRSPPVTRKSSLIFPVYESPPYMQSDMESTSEVESSLCSSQRLGHVTKESLYSSYQQVHTKYQKYKGRFVEMAKAYKKLEAVMSESQDIMLRKNAELKEQCQLEQKAKAHLEEMLRNDLEEKDHIINTLNTKINLLKDGEEAEFDEIRNTGTDKDVASLHTTQGSTQTQVVDTLHHQLSEAQRKLSEQNAIIKQMKETAEKDSSSSSALRNELNARNNELTTLRESQEAEKLALAETKMNFHKELESKDIMIRDLKAQLIVFQDQMNSLESDGKEKERMARTKVEAVDLLKQELQKKLENEASLESNLKEKSLECAAMKISIESKNNECEELKQTIESKNNECEELKQIMESKNNKYEELKQTIESKNNECEELKQTIESKNNKYEELKQTIESKNNECEELKQTIESKNNECEELKQTIESKNNKCEELKQTIESKNNECEELKQTIESKNNECEELKQTIESKNNECEELKQTIESKNNECEELKQTIESKNNECEELKQKMEKLEITLEMLKTSNDEMIKNLEKELCTPPSDNLIEEELNQLREKVKGLEAQNKEHQKDIEEEKIKYSELIKQIENSLKSKEDEIVRTLEEKDQLIHKLKSNLQKLYTDKTNLEKEVNQSNEKWKLLLDENSRLKKTTELLNNTVTAKDKATLVLTQELEEARVLGKELQASNQDKESALKTLKENLNELEKDLVNKKEKLEALKSIQVKYQDLQETCKRLEEKEIDQVNTINQLKTMKDVENSEVSKLKSKMLGTFEENKKMKDHLKSLEAESIKYVGLVEEHNQTISGLKTAINKLETNLLSCKEEFTCEKQNLEKELEAKTKLNADLEEKLSTVDIELKRVEHLISEKNANENKLTENLSQLTKELENLQNVIETKSDEIRTLKSEMSSKDSKLKSMTRNLITVHLELKSTKVLQKNIFDMFKTLNHPLKNWDEINRILEIMKSKASDNTAKLNEVLREKEKLNVTISELSREKENYEIKHDGYIKKIEHYENVLNEKNDEVKTHQDLEHHQETTIQQLNNKNTNLVNELNLLRKEFDEKIKEANENYSKLLEELNCKLNTEKELIKTSENIKTSSKDQEERVDHILRTEMQKKYNELKIVIKKLKEDMVQLKTDITKGVEEKELLKEMAQLKEKILFALKNEKKRVEENYSVLNEKVRGLVIENKELNEEKLSLLEKHAQLSKEMKTVKEGALKSKRDNEINSLTKENEDLILEKEQFIKSIGTLQVELDSKSSALKDLQNELDKMNAVNSELNLKSIKDCEKVELLVKEIDNLTNSIKTLQVELDNNTLKEKEGRIRLDESLLELSKCKASNAEVSSKCKELTKNNNVLTKEKDELLAIKQNLTKEKEALQKEKEELKVPGELAEVKSELSKCKALNIELKSYSEKSRANFVKLANYLKIPISKINTNSPEIDVDTVIEKFKSLQTQVKNKEKNESDFFMLTLEEELKKERLVNKNLEKDLKLEKEKQSKVVESKTIGFTQVKQLQSCCNQVKNELKQLKSFSVEQLDDFTREFIDMKMNLIQVVIKCKYGNTIRTQNETDLSSGNLKKLNEEHTSKIKKLVSDFKQELIAKDEEIRTLENKHFDRRDAEEFYISNELKRSIVNLEEENQALGNSLEELHLEMKQMKTDHAAEISKLISQHNAQVKDLETKWKDWMRSKQNDTEEKFKEECDALTKEWQMERKDISEVNALQQVADSEELESKLQGESNVHTTIAKLTLELNQARREHKAEVEELRRLLNLGNQGKSELCTGEDKVELEYLRNVLFEYMMGKEPLILARVLAAIVKFDPEHTAKVLQREEHKVSLLGPMKFS